MAPPEALKDMVAVGADSDIKPLGYIVWFSVPDRPVKLRTLKLQWALAGLPESVLPDDPRALYLFKRAMREQEGKVRLDDGTVEETDVKDVDEDGDFCTYQISRVVRDKENQVVDYPKAMRVTYKKVDENLTFKALEGLNFSDRMKFEEAISEYIEQHGKTVDGRKVRTVVRKFLRDDPDPDLLKKGVVTGLKGTNMRGKGGGVYFVAAEHKAQLDGVADALSDLYPENAAYLYSIPLADEASERELIRRHHVNETKKEIGEAITDVAKLLRSDRKNAIRSDVKDHWWARLHALQRRAGEYDHLLKDEQDDIKSEIEMLDMQLEKLV